MADRDAIVSFLDELLDVGSFDDHCHNGLQFPGANQVDRLVTGVSASRELFDRAGDSDAQMVLCHHGLLWGGGTDRITPALRVRLQPLFDQDISLLAHHLPLDAHPELGNNALLCELLGMEAAEPFGEHRGRAIGRVGRDPEGIPVDTLLPRIAEGLEREPLLLGDGPATVRSIGIVSGGAASTLEQAIDAGLDAFLTGEPSEPAMAAAREAGIHFIAAGHYATETLGVRRLGELLAERFEIEHTFVDIPNPV